MTFNKKLTNARRWRMVLPAIVMTFALLPGCRTAPQETDTAKISFETAAQRGEQAREGFVRCQRYMEAWLGYADPESGLVPRNLVSDADVWNASDCAADNFPFLVLTSFFTDQEKYHGVMREMLASEIRLTSRVKSMPDTYSFSRRNFRYDSVSMPRIVFGTTEYIKDGLLPITEWLGKTPWSDRMFTMLDDLNEVVDVAGGFGNRDFGSAPEDEVNGELLQILPRAYWMTGEEKYLDWAVQIADHFLIDAFVLDNAQYLRLRDHGCELVAGLSELYVTLAFVRPEKREVYRDRIHKIFDHILRHGRNEDGFFYNAINPKTKEVIQPGLADTWGYTLNGFYSVYLVDSTAQYREAVLKVFENLHKYHGYNWENLGADGFADAIEGALNLYNRIPDERAARWIDAEIEVMWSMQDSAHRENAQQWKNSGIIEGWYGDGNFARTTIMYNLWKSAGTYVQPWTAGTRLGAVQQGDTLYLAVSSAEAWKGKLHFDTKRHTDPMKLPLDWPRINQFPEWFTISPGASYSMEVSEDAARSVTAADLGEGLPLSLKAGEMKHITIIRRQ